MRLFRKRLIPRETIELYKDELLYRDENMLITRWNAIRPKAELHHGMSCYFMKEGYKVSKFLKKDHTLLYWYCDIVSCQYSKEEDSYVFTDLLVDVIIYPDGFVKVVDIKELADVFKDRMIEKTKLCDSLYQLDRLLQIIYSGEFKNIQEKLDEWG